MPPKGDPFNAKTVGLIRAWIDQGANWPKTSARRRWIGWITGRSRKSWPTSPRFNHPIDAFVIRLEAKGLEFNPRADKRTLIRRLYLVMHELPPSPEEVDAVNDAARDAYPELVDKVLASPRYGERWATHWLDLVRFGESHGFETNQNVSAWPTRLGDPRAQ